MGKSKNTLDEGNQYIYKSHIGPILGHNYLRLTKVRNKELQRVLETVRIRYKYCSIYKFIVNKRSVR